MWAAQEVKDERQAHPAVPVRNRASRESSQQLRPGNVNPPLLGPGPSRGLPHWHPAALFWAEGRKAQKEQASHCLGAASLFLEGVGVLDRKPRDDVLLCSARSLQEASRAVLGPS